MGDLGETALIFINSTVDITSFSNVLKYQSIHKKSTLQFKITFHNMIV